VVRAAAQRGLTHLAITDHDRIDGALAGRAAAPAELTVIVGEEIRTSVCDLIGLYLEEPIPAGLSPAAAARQVREQGGLVGLPHPFDRLRASGGRRLAGADLDELLTLVDYVEVFNARLFGSGNQRAAELAAERRLGRAAVSDAHTLLEVGVAYAIVAGPLDTAAELRAALAEARLVTGRGSYLARAATPLAKLIQRARGNGRRAARAAENTPTASSTPAAGR
jgi:predicted metal-dependent phosphoesterase TrpH